MNQLEPQNPLLGPSNGGRWRSRVVSVMLLEGRFLSTSSGTDLTEALLPIIEGGEQIEDILVGLSCVEAEPAKNMRVTVGLETAIDGTVWVSCSTIVSQDLNSPYKVGLHNNRAEYGRYLRLVLKYHSAVGGTTAVARITAHAAIKYVGQ